MKGLSIYTMILIGILLFYGFYQLLISEMSFLQFIFVVALYSPIEILCYKVLKIKKQ